MICEGYGTGRSIAEACPDLFVVCALSANNLVKIALRISELLPDSKIVIAADNDGPGLNAASEAKQGLQSLDSDADIMLGNSKGKNRLNSDSELKKSREWMLSILSSGEIGIADKISETKDKAKAGQLVRCIDIDCLMSDELGIFDMLHDNVHSSAEFSSHLKKKASECYGTAAEAFVTQFITSNIDLRERFSMLKQKLIADMHLENVDGQVGRVADGFALYALTGELACDFGVFTHKPNELLELIFELFRNWLKDRGTTKSMEEKEIIDQVVGFLEQNNARFDQLVIAGNKEVLEQAGSYHNALGIHAIIPDGEVYYIFTRAFYDEICKGLNKKLVRKVLKNKGMLKLDADGKNPKCSHTLPKHKRMVTIEIRSDSME